MVPLVCFCNATAPLPMPMQFNCLRVERISSWPSSFVCLFSAATGGFGLPWVLMFAAAGLMPMPPPLIVHLVCIFMKSLCGLCNKFNSSLFMCHRRDIYHSIWRRNWAQNDRRLPQESLSRVAAEAEERLEPNWSQVKSTPDDWQPIWHLCCIFCISLCSCFSSCLFRLLFVTLDAVALLDWQRLRSPKLAKIGWSPLRGHDLNGFAIRVVRRQFKLICIWHFFEWCPRWGVLRTLRAFIKCKLNTSRNSQSVADLTDPL